MKVDIRILTPEDIGELVELLSVFEDVFEMENFVYPDENYLTHLLQKDNFIAVTVKFDGKVVGGLTVYILDQYYRTMPAAYIYDLAVLTRFQRKGIGKELIDFIRNYCTERGFEEVFVQADKADDYAIEFYRSTKPSEELPAVHFSYTLPQK